ERLVLEGGGAAAEIWLRAAGDRRLPATRLSAEVWRPRLLLDREQRSGSQAKRNAERLAMQVVHWSELTPPRALSDDAAEAVLIGLWAVLEFGWLRESPPFIRHSLHAD
ncbi:MAG: hypothetical protein ACRC1H_13055, partial [Caldilineaceae bacterium]